MKLVVVGGGAGGPTAAARARRLDEGAKIVLFERGEHISYAHCGLPYYIGGVIKDRGRLLVSTPERFRKRYRVEVRTYSEVRAVMPDVRQVEVLDRRTGKLYRERYDKLILSPGADPIRPRLPGADMEGVFSLRNLTDADIILAYISERRPSKAVVVGAGFIGLEMAENLRLRGMDVVVVEKLDQVLPALDRDMAYLVRRTLLSHGVEVVLSDPVDSFTERDDRIAVRMGSGREIICDMVILSIGVRPNVDLAKSAGLKIGEKGGIKVDEHMCTSDPNIYAVGDAVEVRNVVAGEFVLMPLAGPANRQARIAADNIFGRSSSYRGTLGTCVVKLFDITAAATGANEKVLRSHGIPYEKCYLHPFSHATYYPGASQMTMKLLFSPDGGRVLGTQIVGGDGVDKRIDVFSTAISAGMTVEDLTHLELGYVPQYGSAKDPVNMAGYVASNILVGDAPVVHWDGADGGLILDVRTEAEFASDGVPGARNLPVDDIRDNLESLPRDVPIYLYCGVGVRSYVATRILKQHGFDVRNISGGILARRIVDRSSIT
ncbi:MAG TPA: CoA-disulfide reductase [Candidatus Latescibacteria bacterium]|nr:CoA-disulfide reductase [Candidatus Latescibacterota bacterium]